MEEGRGKKKRESTGEAHIERHLKAGGIRWLNEHFRVFAQRRRRRAAPQAESDLGIMILGMFALFAHSAPRYGSQKSFASSLKREIGLGMYY